MEPPVACSLDALYMARRLEEMRALGRVALLSAEASGAQAVLRFGSGHETLARLQAIVAEEASCCPFLALELTDGPDHVMLRIHAPDGGEPVLREIVAAFDSGSA